MKTNPICRIIAVVLCLFAGISISRAVISIDTVLVGDPNNPDDPTTGFGSVDHPYEIGKYEVTIGQYTEFLNAIAHVSDPYSLYNTEMGADPNIAGIARSPVSGGYSYSVIASSANRPVTYVSWFDAARFVNWVQNGATSVADTETGAYLLNGATSGIIYKNPDATWWIPSEDEWYKAAYYDQATQDYWEYPTSSNDEPGTTVGALANQANFNALLPDPGINYLTDAGAFSGSASPFGTFDQGGNVYEWNDAVDGDWRGQRGGAWNSAGFELSSSLSGSGGDPALESSDVGFRIAAIPEPSSLLLIALAGAAALITWRRNPRILIRTLNDD